MMNSANWGEFLLPTLRKVFDKQIDKQKDFVPVIYTIEQSKKAQEFMHGVGSMGQMKKWDETGNQVNYDNVHKGYKVTWTHDKWSNGLRIERELLDDALYPEVKGRTTALADSIYYTRQAHAAKPFNECLTTLGPDGVALASTSHPLGPHNANTWSNYSTSKELSANNVEDIRNDMKEWTDDAGNPLMVNPDTLIVPRKLRKAALVIADTDREPNTVEHNVNIWQGALDVIEWDFLENPNMWFFVDMNRLKRFMYWFERRKPSLEQDKEDFDTEVAKYKVVGRWSFGPADPSFFYCCVQ